MEKYKTLHEKLTVLNYILYYYPPPDFHRLHKTRTKRQFCFQNVSQRFTNFMQLRCSRLWRTKPHKTRNKCAEERCDKSSHKYIAQLSAMPENLYNVVCFVFLIKIPFSFLAFSWYFVAKVNCSDLRRILMREQK